MISFNMSMTFFARTIFYYPIFLSFLHSSRIFLCGLEAERAESNVDQLTISPGTFISVLTFSLSIFQVQDTSFILCIVVIQPEIPVKQLKNLNTVPSSKLLYHRLDLLGQPSACLHFKQLATLGKPCAFQFALRSS